METSYIQGVLDKIHQQKRSFCITGQGSIPCRVWNDVPWPLPCGLTLNLN